MTTSRLSRLPAGKARPAGVGRATVEDTREPWKMTALGMALIVAAAVIMGFLMAGWGPRAELEAMLAPVIAPASPAPAPAKIVTETPAPADVESCNQSAKAHAGNKTIEVVKEGVAEAGWGPGRGGEIGGMVVAAAGTLHGINERKKNDARYVEAYRACMKGRGFSS